MPKKEIASKAEKLWAKSADARTKKAVEKVALLIESYYHLKKQIEEKDGATATKATEKKRQEEKLAILQSQLEEIETEIQKWRGDFTGGLAQTLVIDQLTKLASKTAPKKSTTDTAEKIHKLNPPR